MPHSIKKKISLYDKLCSYNYFLFKPLLSSTAVSDFLPGDFYIKTAEVEEQLIHKAAQPADVVRPLVLSISMVYTCLLYTSDAADE